MLSSFVQSHSASAKHTRGQKAYEANFETDWRHRKLDHDRLPAELSVLDHRTLHVRWRLNSSGSFAIFTAIRSTIAADLRPGSSNFCPFAPSRCGRPDPKVYLFFYHSRGYKAAL